MIQGTWVSVVIQRYHCEGSRERRACIREDRYPGQANQGKGGVPEGKGCSGT